MRALRAAVSASGPPCRRPRRRAPSSPSASPPPYLLANAPLAGHARQRPLRVRATGRREHMSTVRTYCVPPGVSDLMRLLCVWGRERRQALRSLPPNTVDACTTMLVPRPPAHDGADRIADVARSRRGCRTAPPRPSPLPQLSRSLTPTYIPHASSSIVHANKYIFVHVHDTTGGRTDPGGGGSTKSQNAHSRPPARSSAPHLPCDGWRAFPATHGVQARVARPMADGFGFGFGFGFAAATRRCSVLPPGLGAQGKSYGRHDTPPRRAMARCRTDAHGG